MIQLYFEEHEIEMFTTYLHIIKETKLNPKAQPHTLDLMMLLHEVIKDLLDRLINKPVLIHPNGKVMIALNQIEARAVIAGSHFIRFNKEAHQEARFIKSTIAGIINLMPNELKMV